MFYCSIAAKTRTQLTAASAAAAAAYTKFHSQGDNKSHSGF